jgi:multicomponent Na+:H+ antiporter subunit F
MIEAAANITYVLLFISMILVFIRLIKGPSLPDRVVALDLLSILAVAIISTLAIRYHKDFALDVAIALAFVAFLSTVAFARYVDKSCDSSEKEDD